MHKKLILMIPSSMKNYKKNIKERKIPMIQMMRNEALIAFELWDKKTDKVKY